MRLYYFIIVPLIWEGVNVMPSPVIVKNNDIPKRSKNAGKRAMSNDHKQSEVSTANFLDSIIVAIDAGSPKNMDAIARAKKADKVDHFVNSLVEFIKNNVEDHVQAEEYDIKPALVQLRGERPSLMLKLNPETIVNGLKDMLRSKLADVLVEKMSKEAGFLFPLVDE